MCISYQIHWVCDHVEPLDEEPTTCSTYLATEINILNTQPTASTACPLGVTNEVFQSDEPCPACATKFLYLAKQEFDRAMANKDKEGLWLDQMILDTAETQKAVDAWVAKQEVIRQRVEVVMFMAEKGMVKVELSDM